ncbi:hypothetical protein ACTFIY_006506 [Dictyostelium cf. discoideum]
MILQVLVLKAIVPTNVQVFALFEPLHPNPNPHLKKTLTNLFLVSHLPVELQSEKKEFVESVHNQVDTEYEYDNESETDVINLYNSNKLIVTDYECYQLNNK